MTCTVLVVPRSHRAILARVLGPAERPGFVRVETADGRRFVFPTERALARVELACESSEELTEIATRVTSSVDWESVHREVADRCGEALSIRALADALGDASPAAVLRLATDVRRAPPWFRRDGVRLVPVPRAEVEERLRAAEDERRGRAEDDALIAYWRVDGVELSDTARPALDALIRFGESGDAETCPRGRRLANALQLGEADLVLEALDGRDLLPPDFDPMPARCDLPAFTDEQLAEVERVLAIPTEDAGRRDCSDEFAVAIDDVTTTEVDDAIGFRAVGDGWELAVHVADVAAVVEPGGALDALAHERASSVYLPERTLPMLPPSLYRTALSLDTAERRRAVTMRFAFDAGFVLKDVSVERTWVRLTARRVYGRDDDAAHLAATEEEGHALIELARRLRAARVEQGALVLRLPTLRIRRDDGATRLSVRTGAAPGDLVVGEAMILSSSHAGRMLVEAGLPAAFRGQEPPRRALPERDDPLFAIRAVRCLSPTRTTSAARRHHGLGVEAYAQVTSPIRRYGDLLNQRRLLEAAGLSERTDEDLEELDQRIAWCVERERRLRRAANWREGFWLAKEVADGRHVPTEGLLVREPRRGRGAVWSPDLLRELPLDVARGSELPPPGSLLAVQVTRVRPWRARIEVAPEPSATAS